MNYDFNQEVLNAERQLYQDSYYEFLKQAFSVLHVGEPIVDNWHIKKICLLLQRRGEQMLLGQPGKNLIINIPPRSLKSIIVSVVYPAWLWTISPKIKVITSSYNSSLSTDHNMLTRRLVESDWYQELWGHKIQMAPDQNQKGYFENTATGSRRATSTGSGITGKGGDIIIIDDPIDPTRAASEVERVTANKYFDETLSTRLNSPDIGFFIVVMQRLHELDLTGHILEQDPDSWKHICIPAEISPDVKPEVLRKYYTDGLFFPQRFSEKVLGHYKIVLGSYGYAGQLQQTPSPAGGGIWKKWLNIVPDKDFPDRNRLEKYGTDWDLAYTEKEENSASAYITSGQYEGKMYIDKIGYVNHEFPKLLKFMAVIPEPHYIEGMASGKSAKQTLTSMGISAIEVPVTGGDKTARANMATPFAEAGMVCIRESLADMMYHDINQGILIFPNGRHDDLADTLSQAIQRHFKKREIWAA
jgi:predicted phage terminase large subunit-like protein